MGNLSSSRNKVPALASLVCLLTVFPRLAYAHVKWFCAFDVAGQPQGLETLLCADFEQLNIIAVAVLFCGCVIERSGFGNAIIRSLDRTMAWFRVNTDLVLRATVGFFFVAVWTIGGIILTPELKTTSALVPWIQVAIVAGLLKRRTLPVSALGMAALYLVAIRDYGIFHLMDYPIFIGVAIYFALTGLQRDVFGVRPLDVVRWAAAITLMWASVEKWAYPEWSFPLLITHPAMTLGYDVAYFMRAAGAIEFTLAFALLWTPLVRRISALMLTGVFISAISEFGKVDAIGHSAIIAVLLVLAADNEKAVERVRWHQPVFAPLGYGVSLAGFLLVYYAAHALMFGTVLL